MHILVDITHPAHVHFFRHSIAEWRERGHELTIAARRKDIAIELMTHYGWDFVNLGAARSGLAGLTQELLVRNAKLWRLVRRRKPDVMAAIGGIFIAHVGWLTGTPSVVFTDTENATLSNRLTFPFATAVVTPDCYEAPVPSAKHVTYAGYHELAYTHPNRFTPDPERLRDFGVEPGEDYVVLRLVSWGAAHDVHDSGFADAVQAVRRLEEFGRVLISSEKPLPPELEPKRLAGPLEHVHHLLHYARLFIGESATMASESVTLGTPAVFVSTSTRGYTNEQGSRYDAAYTFTDPVAGQQQALDKAVEILRDPDSKAKWRAKADRILADKIDVTQFIVDTVEQHARR